MMPEKTTGQKALFCLLAQFGLATGLGPQAPGQPRPKAAYASCLTLSAACAAARRATGTRNGEQLT
jgi:hypothetical protein